MNKTVLSVILFPVLFILAWWMGYTVYKPETRANQNIEYSDSGTKQNRVTVAEKNTGGEIIPRDDSVAVVSNSFSYKAWSIAETSDQAKACFEFSKNVAPNGDVLLADYVRVVPKIPLSFSVKDNALCVGGFDFDKDYSLTFLKGLRSTEQTITLNKNVSVDISFEDKPAYVAFAGEGIILPRINAQGLGIETINVERLSVEIARIGERMIARRDPQSGSATLEGHYSWEYNDAAKTIRSVIWSGEIPVESKKNETVTTVLPFADLTGALDPGAYVVTAERVHGENERNVARAWRWIISTDLALSSYRGKDGLTVAVRSIDSAMPLENIQLNLVAKNNDILGTQKTNSDGVARFAAPLLKGKNIQAPKMVMAFSNNDTSEDGDYAFLDLSRTPLDVSEYDVAGRSVANETDVYAFSDRGVYRPGEEANLTFLFRDMNGNAIDTQPVTLSVRRPNGLEVHTERFLSEHIAKQAGSLSWLYTVPKSAQRGVWTVIVKQEGSGEIGRVQFSVEDFVPAKLRLSVKADKTPIRADERRDIEIDAQFLYGAPGAGLEGEAEARIRVDPKPFSGFADYQFGPSDNAFEERLIIMGTGITDGAGRLPLSLNLKNENVRSNHPLRAEITVGISEPGGRYVRDSVRIPLRTQDVYAGLKADFSGRRAPRGKPAGFQIIAVGADGEAKSEDLEWTLFSEDWDYQWYRERGRWKYRRDKRDQVIDSGSIAVQAGAPAHWAQRLDWGHYRLEVKTITGTVSSVSFGVGWAEASTSDRPDSLQIAGPSKPLKSGEPITLSINAPYAGQASLVIADDTVRMIKNIQIPEGGSEITLPFNAEWGQSVYALLSVYTPRDRVGRPIPRRAVGISYIERDRSDQKLELNIISPAVLRPRQPQSFTVNVSNVSRNAPVWMSFAAVDEGILQLTKYKSPDAADYFFGKKALALTLRDDYARLLNANLGAPAIANSGGDSLGGEGLTVVPTRTVSLFEGPIQVKDGKATITLNIPDFNGELRLMATAWTQTSVGSASRPVTIRDKVPAIVGLPRFLAPGDRAFATVSLDNVEGVSGDYLASLNTSGMITGGGDVMFTLDPGQRREDRLELLASEIGTDLLKLEVSGAGNYEAVSDYPIEVRSPFRPLTLTKTTLLEAGEALVLDSEMVSDFNNSGTDITVSFSSMAGLDAQPYVQSLSRYPYGCTEQTVSTAMPLLYSQVLGGFTDQKDSQTRKGVKEAIDRLISRQSSDGAFGLWREGDGYARPWLGIYVTDFLLRADEEGYDIPETVRRRALKAIRKIAEMPDYPNIGYDFSYGLRYGDDDRAQTLKAEAAAYAHYVLAKSGQGDLSGLRYIFDTQSQFIQTPIAHAYLGAALKMMGDRRRSEKAFITGQDFLGKSFGYDYYQSPLRDAAGYIIAASEGGLAEETSMVETFLKSLKSPEALNTHEKAYVILAIQSLSEGSERPMIKTANIGDPKDMETVFDFYPTDLEKSPTFTNSGVKKTWAITTIQGTPKIAPKPQQTGFSIAKTVFKKDGSPYSSGPVKQGESLIVKIEFSSKFDKDRTVVLADLLPAGFEIETILKPEDGARRDGKNGAYSDLGDISDFSITEARDDRFVASVQSDSQETYIAAYIMRAVTPGDYVFPGVVVEDMYRPAEVALTQSSRISISNNPTL